MYHIRRTKASRKVFAGRTSLSPAADQRLEEADDPKDHQRRVDQQIVKEHRVYGQQKQAGEGGGDLEEIGRYGAPRTASASGVEEEELQKQAEDRYS